MREVIDALHGWQRTGAVAGLATVAATWSSAPRRPGATMAVGPDGSVVGSVSGGCVEAEVYELCRAAADGGRARTVRFGVQDDDALEAGLPCGGTVEIRVEAVAPDSAWLPALVRGLDAQRPVALLTRLDDDGCRHLVLTADGHSGTLGSGAAANHVSADGELDPVAVRDGRLMLAAGETGILTYDSGARVLVVSHVPPPRMIVFGATEHAAATARIGSFLGFRVTLCDPRPVFATESRHPGADEVVVDWPHRYLAAEAAAGRLDARTAICVLTHDPRVDVPALAEALKLPVAYVGAMGSRRSHDDRLRRLRETGLDEEALTRLSSPIGLDLGAHTPEETAVSIAAEIVALRRGGTGARLRDTRGPVTGPKPPGG